MELSHLPFMAVTVTALFTHIISSIVAVVLEPVWKGDSFLSRWWTPAQIARFFSVKRAEVKRPVTWGCIITSRVALTVAVVSFGLDLIIN
jgi:hypothetical protein